MISKEANDLLLNTLGYVALILFFVYIGIPLLILAHNTCCPFLKEYHIVPSIFTYYGFVFSFTPKCSKFADFCSSKGQEITARDREIERKENEAKNEEKKIKNSTISHAIQQGDLVYVYNENGGTMFYKSGRLQGFTNSSVTIKYQSMVYVYNSKGVEIDSKYCG